MPEKIEELAVAAIRREIENAGAGAADPGVAAVVSGAGVADGGAVRLVAAADAGAADYGFVAGGDDCGARRRKGTSLSLVQLNEWWLDRVRFDLDPLSSDNHDQFHHRRSELARSLPRREVAKSLDYMSPAPGSNRLPGSGDRVGGACSGEY